MPLGQLWQRGTSGLVIEDVGAEIDSIRPADRSRVRIHSHLAKYVHFFKGGKHAAATNDSVAEINLTV